MSIIRITKKDKETKARLGILSLPHGDVETPAFMPVGTNGTVKGIYHDTIRKIGYRLILANTYHLYLRPGTEVLDDFGGLHGFSSWDGVRSAIFWISPYTAVSVGIPFRASRPETHSEISA